MPRAPASPAACLPCWPRALHAHLCADLANQGKGREGAGVNALIVEVAHVHLNACMVLCCDQLVGPRAVCRRGATYSSGAGSAGRCRPSTAQQQPATTSVGVPRSQQPAGPANAPGAFPTIPPPHWSPAHRHAPLARDVQVHNLALVVLHRDWRGTNVGPGEERAVVVQRRPFDASFEALTPRFCGQCERGRCRRMFGVAAAPPDHHLIATATRPPAETESVPHSHTALESCRPAMALRRLRRVCTRGA